MIPIGQHIEVKPLEVSKSISKEHFQKGIVKQVSVDVKSKINKGDVILFSPAKLIFIDGTYLLQIESVELVLNLNQNKKI